MNEKNKKIIKFIILFLNIIFLLWVDGLMFFSATLDFENITIIDDFSPFVLIIWSVIFVYLFKKFWSRKIYLILLSTLNIFFCGIVFFSSSYLANKESKIFFLKTDDYSLRVNFSNSRPLFEETIKKIRSEQLLINSKKGICLNDGTGNNDLLKKLHTLCVVRDINGIEFIVDRGIGVSSGYFFSYDNLLPSNYESTIKIDKNWFIVRQN